jgi:hypothetical protein
MSDLHLALEDSFYKYYVEGLQLLDCNSLIKFLQTIFYWSY